MARKLVTVQEIRDFVVKVQKEANHHASEVEHVILELEHAVLSRINLPIDTFSVYERNGNLARNCWVVLGGNRYAFSYNYDAKKIELRDRSNQGPVIHSFDNTTPSVMVQSVIARL